MIKWFLSIFGLTITLFFNPILPTVKAIELPSCSSSGFNISIDPPSPEVNKSFKINVLSDKIKTGDQFSYKLVEFGKDGNLTSQTKVSAGGDGSISITFPRVTSVETVQVRWYWTGPTCVSNAFNIIAAAPDPPANQPVNPAGGTNTGPNTANAADDLNLGNLRDLLSTDKQVKDFGNLGGLVSSILELVFILSGILMFIWALMGVFQYITAGGNKEGLAKARARITWAIVGFLFIVISFSISRYIKELTAPFNLPIQSVNSPTNNRGTPTCTGRNETWDPVSRRCVR